jgi:hypothetical protein
MRTIVCGLLLGSFAGCESGEVSVADNPAAAVQNSTSANLREQRIDDTVLEPKTVLGGSLTLLVPKGFTTIDGAELRKRYPAENRPSLVFSNQSESVNIVIDFTKNEVLPGQLRQLHQTLDAGMRRQYPKATWLESGLRRYGDRQWSQIEFISPASKTNIQNLMLATSAEGRMLSITFNTTEGLAAQWMPVGRRIVETLSVTD